MQTPTVDDIKTWSRVSFDALDVPFDDDALDVQLTRALGYFAFVTGRPVDTSMPAEFESMAEQAIQMRVEQLAFQAQPDYVETGSDDQISNFSAGNYSETRRAPNDRAKMEAGRVIPPINSWPSLNELLWMLCTSEKQDYWMSQLGMGVPAFEVSEVDWADFVAWPGDNSYGALDRRL